MVLQDVDSQSPDSFADNPYPSDNDPYSQRPPQFLRINMDQLPRPIPIIGPVIGFSQAKSQKVVGSYLRTAMEMAGRQLTQDEATAMAYHIARKESQTSYGATLGLSVGIWKWYKGREIYRFPWYTPKPEWFNPNKLGPFTGQIANNLWHTFRCIPFALVGIAAGQLLAMNWATAVAAVGVQRDPKLKDFNETLKAKLNERRIHRDQGSRDIESSVPSRQPTTPSFGRSAPVQEDDMSPTAGNASWSSPQDSDRWGTPTADSLDRTRDIGAKSTEAHQRTSPEGNQRWSEENGNRPSSQWSSQPEDRSAPDDASPTGGLFEAETKTYEDSGSAWERIRRGAASGNPPPNRTSPWDNAGRSVQREQKEGSTSGNSFSFSSTDEERQLAKAEAQREFDERIERERRGSDFNDERRW